MGPGPQTDNVDSANSSGLSQAGAGNYADGRNGTNYGTGGSGGIAHRAPAQGGNGADGVVVIEY